MKLSTKDLIYISLLSALCAIATTIKVDLPNGAMAHMGSAALFTISSVFGGLYGGLAGAIGSGLFDLLMGHSAYTPFSIVIKGGVGLIIGLLTVGFRYQKGNPPSIVKVLIAMLIGAVLTALGYLVAWAVVLGGWQAGIVRLPASFITSGVGIIVSIFLIPILKRALKNL